MSPDASFSLFALPSPPESRLHTFALHRVSLCFHKHRSATSSSSSSSSNIRRRFRSRASVSQAETGFSIRRLNSAKGIFGKPIGDSGRKRGGGGARYRIICRIRISSERKDRRGLSWLVVVVVVMNSPCDAHVLFAEYLQRMYIDDVGDRNHIGNFPSLDVPFAQPRDREIRRSKGDRFSDGKIVVVVLSPPSSSSSLKPPTWFAIVDVFADRRRKGPARRASRRDCKRQFASSANQNQTALAT